MEIFTKLKKTINKGLFATFIVHSIFIAAFVLLIYERANTKNNDWYMEEIYHTKAIRNYKKSNQTIAIIDSGYFDDGGFNNNQIIKKHNFIDNNDDVTDDLGHGTTLLSLLIGYKKGKMVVKGMNNKVNVMILKVTGKTKKADVSLLSDAIYYAVENKATIINISLGFEKDAEKLKTAIDFAINKGVIVVAPVGDLELNKSFYPAAYSGVISVEAQDYFGRRYELSNVFKDVKIRFPGVDLKSLSYNPIIDSFEIQKTTGSSNAAILVSGMLAIIKDNGKKIDFDYFQKMMKKDYFIDLKKMLK